MAVTDQTADAAAVRLSIERAHFDFPDAQRNDFFSHAAFNGGWKISPPLRLTLSSGRDFVTFSFFSLLLASFSGKSPVSRQRNFLFSPPSFPPAVQPQAGGRNEDEGVPNAHLWAAVQKFKFFERKKDHKKTKEHRRHMRGKP